MFSGPFVVVFYSVEIYKNSGVEVNEHFAAILSAAVRVGGQFKSSLNRPFVSEPNSLRSLMALCLTIIRFSEEIKLNITTNYRFWN